MIDNKITIFCLALLILLLEGCQPHQYTDLEEFVSNAKAKKVKPLEPFPEVRSYKPFTYKASGMRSPFRAPNVSNFKAKTNSNVKPLVDRNKHYLEKFAFDDFQMVGSLKRQNVTKGLVKVNNQIYLVSVGDYLGKNHGRVVNITERELNLVELVPNGPSSWIERPRRLNLKNKK